MNNLHCLGFKHFISFATNGWVTRQDLSWYHETRPGSRKLGIRKAKNLVNTCGNEWFAISKMAHNPFYFKWLSLMGEKDTRTRTMCYRFLVPINCAMISHPLNTAFVFHAWFNSLQKLQLYLAFQWRSCAELVEGCIELFFEIVSGRANIVRQLAPLSNNQMNNTDIDYWQWFP